jgi:hypothetical protein
MRTLDGMLNQAGRRIRAPRDVRHRLRENGDFKRHFGDFREYLATQDALRHMTLKAPAKNRQGVRSFCFAC